MKVTKEQLASIFFNHSEVGEYFVNQMRYIDAKRFDDLANTILELFHNTPPKPVYKVKITHCSFGIACWYYNLVGTEVEVIIPDGQDRPRDYQLKEIPPIPAGEEKYYYLPCRNQTHMIAMFDCDQKPAVGVGI